MGTVPKLFPEGKRICHVEILAGKAFQEEGRVGAKMEGQGWAGAFKGHQIFSCGWGAVRCGGTVIGVGPTSGVTFLQMSEALMPTGLEPLEKFEGLSWALKHESCVGDAPVGGVRGAALGWGGTALGGGAALRAGGEPSRRPVQRQ